MCSILKCELLRHLQSKTTAKDMCLNGNGSSPPIDDYMYAVFLRRSSSESDYKMSSNRGSCPSSNFTMRSN